MKIMSNSEFKIALLIDSENVRHQYIESVLNEISKYGKIVIQRFYGNINQLSKEWEEKSKNFAIKPVHQFNVASGKNAADMALALDALEIMYQGRVDAFFLVTSDSDFTPLATKLREGGMHVVGIGAEGKVSRAFTSACNQFKYFEIIYDEEDNGGNIKNNKVTSHQEVSDIIKNVIVEKGEDNAIQLSRLGDILVNRYSDFDTRKYGSKNLSNLVSTIPGLHVYTEKSTTYVKLISNMSYEAVSKIILDLVNKTTKKEMLLTNLILKIKELHPDFEYNELGFSKFAKLVSSIEGIIVKDNSAKIQKLT
jgi:uncharacterized protein (TIGR00288 family)